MTTVWVFLAVFVLLGGMFLLATLIGRAIRWAGDDTEQSMADYLADTAPLPELPEATS